MISNLTGSQNVPEAIPNSAAQSTPSSSALESSSIVRDQASNNSVAPTAQRGAVSISGEAIMLSRLFMSAGPGNVPSYTQLDKSTMTVDPRKFLTRDDRDLLANLYSYAQLQGVDLRYVDDIASDLGMYRKFGSVECNLNDGANYDWEGHALTYSFTAADATTAKAILDSRAIDGSKFDSGFLRYELDPGFSPNHSANFSFLQSMVEHFSSEGASVPQNLAGQFSTWTPNGQNNFVVETSPEVTLKLPTADNASEAHAQANKGVQNIPSFDSVKTKLVTSLLDGLRVWGRRR